MASTRRITVKVHEHLWVEFTKQTEALFLKRDAFLNAAIRSEIPYLATELESKRLSQEAKSYLSSKFNGLRPIPVNIMLEEDVVTALDQVVNDTNLFREGFINRLIVWLRSSDDLLRYFEIPFSLDGLNQSNGMPVSPLKAMEAIRDAPLTFVRSRFEGEGQGLYSVPFPEAWLGFSCYLADEYVPGTDAYKAKEQEMALLFEPEASVFGQAKRVIENE